MFDGRAVVEHETQHDLTSRLSNNLPKEYSAVAQNTDLIIDRLCFPVFPVHPFRSTKVPELHGALLVTPSPTVVAETRLPTFL
jgi:hypothetical protein